MRLKFILLSLLFFTATLITYAQAKRSTVNTGTLSLTASINAGKAVYTKYCISCHQADGLGVQKMNPPLSKTSWVLGDKVRIIKVVLNGLSATDIDDETFNNVMASFDYLKDDDIANVLTYVRNNFGNKASAVKPAEVARLRAKKK